MEKVEAIKKKINDFIISKVLEVEKEGKASFSTCDHYNWDRDIWDYRNTIISKLRDRGYGVSTNTKWGVLDVTITLQF